MRRGLPAGLELGMRHRLGLGLLALWVAWAVVAAALAGDWIGFGSPYLVAPAALAVGVLAGQRAAAAPPSKVPAMRAVALGALVVTLLAAASSGTPATRPLGYANANAALALQLAAVLALVARRAPRAWPWVCSALATALAIVVLNRSIGGLIIMWPLALAILCSWLRPRRLWPALVVAGLAVAAAMAGVGRLAGIPVWPPELLRGLDAARQWLWQDTLAAWRSAPVHGVGPGRLPEWLRLGYDPDTASAHSAVLQIGAETGWVGLALFVAIAVGGLAWIRRGSAPEVLIAAAAWAVLLVHAQADHLLDFPPVVVAAGIVLGWTGALGSEQLDVGQRQRPVARRGRRRSQRPAGQQRTQPGDAQHSG